MEGQLSKKECKFIDILLRLMTFFKIPMNWRLPFHV
jgi:hypothetical protein